MLTRRSSRLKNKSDCEKNNIPIINIPKKSSKRKSNESTNLRKISKPESNDLVNEKIVNNSKADLSLGSTSDRNSLNASDHTSNRKGQSVWKTQRDAEQKYNEVLACYSASQYVLSKNYVDVVSRLNLTFPAKCTQSLIKCCNGHHKNHVNN